MEKGITLNEMHKVLDDLNLPHDIHVQLIIACGDLARGEYARGFEAADRIYQVDITTPQVALPNPMDNLFETIGGIVRNHNEAMGYTKPKNAA